MSPAAKHAAAVAKRVHVPAIVPVPSIADFRRIMNRVSTTASSPQGPIKNSSIVLKTSVTEMVRRRKTTTTPAVWRHKSGPVSTGMQMSSPLFGWLLRFLQAKALKSSKKANELRMHCSSGRVLLKKSSGKVSFGIRHAQDAKLEELIGSLPWKPKW